MSITYDVASIQSSISVTTSSDDIRNLRRGCLVLLVGLSNVVVHTQCTHSVRVRRLGRSFSQERDERLLHLGPVFAPEYLCPNIRVGEHH